MKQTRVPINLFVVLIFLAGIYISQFSFDKTRAREIKPSPYLPNAEVVRASDLGLHSAASSLYWLASIQYLGDWQDDKYQKLPSFLNLSTELDPKFSHPYAFGTLILPSLEQFDEAVKLGERGINKADPNWEIPYYLGTAYHMYKNDSENAAKYFDIAARTPGAPANIAWVSANYGSRPDLRSQTILIWNNIAENTKDPELKKRAEIYIYHFQLMDFLEQAAAQYKQKHGIYPDPIDKLVENKILKEIPGDPLGYKYKIDDNGKAKIMP